jgi:large subunit ribosomal protein L14
MIQDGTIVNITDNTGGKVGKVFKILGSSKSRYAGIGDKVIISIKVADPRKIVKKKDVQQAVVVRTVKSYRRNDGSYISFDDNAVVILEKDKLDPLGGRVFGPIPRELAERGYQKIISLAQEVI